MEGSVVLAARDAAELHQAGVAGAGDPRRNSPYSKSKSRGGFCSNQSRSCSGVS
jgi:hypothetical protein